MKDNSHIWYIVLIGLVVISAVGTLMFLWYTQRSNSAAYQPIQTTYTPAPRQSSTPSVEPSAIADAQDEQITKLKKIETSDELSSIESDIKNTDISNLDKEITEIEEALQ